MELSTIRDSVKNSEKATNTRWLLRVDGEIWGYVISNYNAQWFLEQISTTIKDSLQKEHPNWTVDCVDDAAGNVVKINCVHPGYVYNSSWTAHTVSYDPVFRLTRETSSFDIPKDGPNLTSIREQEKTFNPQTRLPTPQPKQTDCVPTPPPPPLPTITLKTTVERRKFKKKRKSD